MQRGYQPFPNTHWSMVRRAGWGEGEGRAAALRVVLERYMPALESYLRWVKRVREEEAEEILQAFVADKMLEEAFLRHADERRGRFRTFLLTCLQHFCASRKRAERVRWTEMLEGEGVERVLDSGGDARVEAEWARSLVRDVLRMMEEECARSGRGDVWMVFEGRVLREIFGEAGERVVGYEELAEKLGVASPVQAANLLVTGKRMYARLLKGAIAEYEKEEGGQEAEIAELCAILARCPAVPEE